MFFYSNPNGEEPHALGQASDKLIPPGIGGAYSYLFTSNPMAPRVLGEPCP